MATQPAVTPTLENPAGATTGTNDPIRTTETTQAINTDSNSGRFLQSPFSDIDDPVESATGAQLTPGTPTRDDTDQDTARAQQIAVDAMSNTVVQIKPQPNVLDEYPSYSYSASVYLLTEDQYSKLLVSKIKKVDGYQLLFQSGGAPNNVGGIRSPIPTTGDIDTAGSLGNPSDSATDGGRNPFFDNDFYIDSVTIKNELPGKATGAAHSVTEIKFTVVEPNGITLLDRLYQAVANSRPVDATGKVNYMAVTYLMVMRFYGYDQDGKATTMRGSNIDSEGTSDPRAVVEKFIPFKVSHLNWSVGSGLVQYTWDCAAAGQAIAGYSARGTIPYDLQIVDSTVGSLLGKNFTYSTASASAANPGASTTADPANQTDATLQRTGVLPNQNGRGAPPGFTQAPASPQNINAAPTAKTSITAGLMGAMNAFQQQLVRQGTYTYADEYLIEFVGEGADQIESAKLVPPNTKVTKSLTAAAPPTTSKTDGLDPKKTSVDMTSRSFSITAGQQLLQAIELTIRNSSYISDQALVIFEPDGSYKPNPNANNTPLKWFTVVMSAEVISPAIDPKRNDFAYRIKYTVAPFVIKNINSKYFSLPTFTGVHKSYPYWFTGQNTAVLEYRETLNTLYQATISGSDTEKNDAAKNREKIVSSMADILTYTYSPRSNESSSGAAGKVNELGANAAELIYSVGDLANCKIKIVGDPAWIMQGSVYRAVTDETFRGTAVSSGFLPDGSIAFDNQEILFEIVWQRPEDYDLNTGLADPYAKTQAKYFNRKPIQSRVYKANTIVSEFNRGSFEQHLEGTLYQFIVPDKANAANPAAAADDGSSDRVQAARLADLSRNRASQADAAAGVVSTSATTSLTGARSADNLNTAASASVLGSQAFARLLPSNTTAAGRVEFGIPTLAVSSLTAGAAQLLPAGYPSAPTTETGAALGSATSIAAVPRKIGDISASTVAQVTALSQDTGLVDTTSPTSKTNPANQQISRDF